MMKGFLKLSCAMFSAAILAGCASGVPVTESKVAGEPVPNGKARVAIYRTNLLGAAIQPVVRVDGRETGRCTPQGVFYVDVNPGQHNLSATTEVEKTSYLSVKEGETAYVKCSIGLGLFVGQPRLDIVSSAVGRTDTQKLKVTGKY
jgi:hypothetical protein